MYAHTPHTDKSEVERAEEKKEKKKEGRRRRVKVTTKRLTKISVTSSRARTSLKGGEGEGEKIGEERWREEKDGKWEKKAKKKRGSDDGESRERNRVLGLFPGL